MLRSRFVLRLVVALCVGLGSGVVVSQTSAEAAFCYVSSSIDVQTPTGVSPNVWGTGQTAVVKAKANYGGFGCTGQTMQTDWNVQFYMPTCGHIPLDSGSTLFTNADQQVSATTLVIPTTCPSGSEYNVGSKVERGTGFALFNYTPVNSLAGFSHHDFKVVIGAPTNAFPGDATIGGQAPTGLQADPVSSATGAFTHAETDFDMPVRGAFLDAWRTYSSNLTRAGVLGTGWTTPFSDSLVVGSSQVTWRTSYGSSVVFRQNYGTVWYPPLANASRLKTNSDGTLTVTTEDRWALKFTSSGELTSMTDRNGQTLDISRDGSDRLSTVSSSGRTLAYAYNSAGLLVTVTATGSVSGSSAVTTYTYTNGKLTGVSQPGGVSEVYGYDSSDRLNSIRNADSSTPQIQLVYGSDGRVVSQKDGNGNESTWTWDSSTGTSKMTDPRGGEWKDVYVRGWLVKQVDPTGVTANYDWSDDGWLSRITDTTGDDTTFEYDPYGHVTSRIDADGNQETFGFDTDQQEPSSTKDFLGRSTSFTYDTNRNVKKVTPPLSSAVTNLTYTPTTFDLATIADPTEQTTSWGYNSTTGDNTSITSPTSDETTFTYDGFGRVASVTPPAGNATGATGTWATSYTRDGAGRITETDGPTGVVNTATYDGFGRLDTYTDARGNDTTYDYDNAGHVTSITTADTSVSPQTMTYDANGNVATSTDPRGVTTTFEYDAANRPTEVTRDSKSWHFTYDSNGRRHTIEAPSGRTTTLTWDDRSLLTKVDYSDSTHDVNFSYDAAGRRTSMTDDTGTTTYGYDALDRVTSVTNGSDTWAYTWDDSGRMASRTAPHQTTVSYTYDNSGRLKTVVRGSTTLATYTYDVGANTTTRTQGNGVKTVQAFDRNGYLHSTVEKDSSDTILSSTTYLRDEVGNPTRVTDKDGNSTTQKYDELNRLTDVCYDTTTCTGATDFIGYTYDANSNLTTEVRPAGTKTFHYDDLDQLTQTTGLGGTQDYDYDDDGNRTADPNTTYDVNAAGQITSSTTGSTATTYEYNGNGQLAASTKGSTTDTFDYDPVSAQLVGERDGSSVTRAYVYGHELLNMYSVSDNTYYSTDQLGSVTETRTSAGDIQRTFAYEPYGAIKSQTAVTGATASPLMYTSGYTANAGDSYQFGVRQYNPSSANFVTPDQGGSGDAYRYALSNPTVYSDQLGRWPGKGLLHDINKISGAVTTGASFVALGCTVAVFCAPLVPIAGTIAGIGAAVNGLSGAALALDACTSGKGSCAGEVVLAAANLLASRFGGGRLTSLAEDAATSADIGGAKFAQKSFSETFSKGGSFSGRTIDDVAGSLRSGAMSPKDVPIDVITRDGNTLILNTRSSQALIRGGIPRGSWNVIDRTGQSAYEARLTGQLGRNGLSSSGTDLP